MKPNNDITDAVGDLILNTKKMRKRQLRIKIMTWLIVVIAVIFLVLLLSTKVAISLNL